MPKRFTIEYVKQYVKEKGGNCLSECYFGIRGKLQIQCPLGHIWETSFSGLQDGHWCHICSGKKLTITAMQEMAKELGGKCLSERYIHQKHKLLWECAKGHQWYATPTAVRNKKRWCHECSGYKLLDINQAHAIARKRGGKCLSDIYNSKFKLKWQCTNGHQWDAHLNQVKNAGTWCSSCAGTKKLTLTEMQMIANKRGGKCLSEQYTNQRQQLLWECEFGHQWPATSSNIKRGKWCPDCSGSKGESAVRAFLERIYDRKFPKKRPHWLRKDKSRYELDGYCEELGIAFEYHGKYHFKESHNWYPGGYSFHCRQEMDAFKRDRCKNNNINLVEIYEFKQHASDEENKQTIVEAIIKAGLAPPLSLDDIPFGNELWFASQNLFEEANELAKLKGGLCLSKIVKNTSQKIKWQCSSKHSWETSLYSVKRGHWCRKCAKYERFTIDIMQEIAIKRGGKCLSPIYVNTKTKLSWQCKYGHQWFALPYNIIKYGKWCPHCIANSRFTIEEKFPNDQHNR